MRGSSAARDADAGVPDLDVDVRRAWCAPPRRCRRCSVYLMRVLDQVAEDALEQLRVAGDRLAAGREAQAQAGQLGLAGEVHVQPAEQVAQREVLEVRLDRAGVQPRDVEHRVERAVQPVDRRARCCAPAARRCVPCSRFSSVAANRPERMHRLAQVVARDGEEAALFLVGAQRARRARLRSSRMRSSRSIELRARRRQRAVARASRASAGRRR